MRKAVKDIQQHPPRFTSVKPQIYAGGLRSENYYLNQREKIHNQLAELPVGTIKRRQISGNTYYYLQHREGKKVIHKYIGKQMPKELKRAMQKRKTLKSELAKIQDVLIGFFAEKIKGLR